MKILAATGGLVFILILAVAGPDVAGLKGSDMVQSIRKPAVAGQFYSSDPEALRSEIEKYIDVADPPSLEGDTWIYWRNRFKTMAVEFDNDGKVKNIGY